MAAYSFLDVSATIVGPGGAFALGTGAGASEEGIDIDMVENKNTMTIGADGEGMHSLHASNAGKVKVMLLKTSTTNALLSLLYNLQSSNSSLWGQNVIVVTNVQSGDVITLSGCAFDRQTPLKYAKEAGTNTWSFDVITVDELLGTGSPVA